MVCSAPKPFSKPLNSFTSRPSLGSASNIKTYVYEPALVSRLCPVQTRYGLAFPYAKLPATGTASVSGEIADLSA